MLVKQFTIMALLVVLLSTGAPLGAYCPTTSPGTCPTVAGCVYRTYLPVPSLACTNPPYCWIDIFDCPDHVQYCTRGCIAW